MASQYPRHRYMLRSECPRDILCFLRRLTVACLKEKHWIDSFSVTRFNDFPDCTMEFTTTLSLERIRQILASIPDGHVMLESVDYFTQYSGERNGKISTIYKALTKAAKSYSDEEFPLEGDGHWF